MSNEKAPGGDAAAGRAAKRPAGSHRRLKTCLFTALSVSVVTMVTILYVTMDRSTWRVLGSINPYYFVVILLMIIGRWLATCLRTFILLRSAGVKPGFGKTAKAVLAGGFAGAVTPFHSAGIPTEVFLLSHYGVGAGAATAAIATGLAMSILLFTLSLPVILALSAARIEVGFGFRTLLAAGGLIGFFFFLATAYSMKSPERVTRFLTRRSPGFLKKRPGFERRLGRLAVAIEEFSGSLRTIIGGDKRVIVGAAALTVVFWGAGFFVAPLTLCGLGYPELFWKAMLAQLVVSGLLPFMPLPGESGFAEAAFAGVFTVFVPGPLVGVVTLSWRFFMFYIVLLVNGAVFLLAVRDAGAGRRRELSAVAGEGCAFGSDPGADAYPVPQGNVHGEKENRR